jgi:hypothetical protein
VLETFRITTVCSRNERFSNTRTSPGLRVAGCTQKPDRTAFIKKKSVTQAEQDGLSPVTQIADDLQPAAAFFSATEQTKESNTVLVPKNKGLTQSACGREKGKGHFLPKKAPAGPPSAPTNTPLCQQETDALLRAQACATPRRR